MPLGRIPGRRAETATLCLGLVLGGTGCASEAYDVSESISYDSTIGYQGTLDFYEPEADSGRTHRPAILAIHGGAWRGGDKAWGEQFAEELCPFGYVVISINYRLSSRPRGTWPAQIEDVQKALKYVRANASRFRIDPDRIASLGMSAGGHLATMGHAAPWSEGELRDISTLTFARPDVSILTVHGAGDDNVYVTQGERITAALQSKGAETEFVRLEGEEGKCHEDCWKVPRARKAMHRFLDRTLSHDGNRFYEEKHGVRSPLRD